MKLNFYKPAYAGKCSGFTLTEVLVASAISIIILTGVIGVNIFILRSWHSMMDRMDADSDVNIALSRMIYGIGDLRGIRAAKGVTLKEQDNGWELWYVTGTSSSQSNRITYSEADTTLVLDPGNHLMGTNITDAAVTVQFNHIEVRLKAEVKEGDTVKTQREIETKIYWRN